MCYRSSDGGSASIGTRKDDEELTRIAGARLQCRPGSVGCDSFDAASGLRPAIPEDHMSIPPISDLLYEDIFKYPLALILAPILSPVWIIRIGPQGCRRIRAPDFRDSAIVNGIKKNSLAF